MTLLLTFVLVAAALFVFFWGGTLVAQGYLYQQPTDRLPAKAGGAAALVAVFLTFWVWLDRGSPGKYDTFFEFAPYSTAGFDEFEAVRWQADPGGKGLKLDPAGKPAETATRYKRAGGGKTAPFAENGTGPAFKLSTAAEMTGAIVLRPAAGGDPVRFDAELKEDKGGRKTYFGEKRFVDPAGRYVRGDQPGVLYVPSTGVVVGALALNALLFVVFLAAFWPGLRFEFWHAVGLAGVFGLVTMLLVMPLLFKPNRAAARPQEAAAAPGDGGHHASS